MVKIVVDKPEVQILYSGDPMLVAGEIAAAASGIYQGMSSASPENAMIFRECLCRFFSQDSPVWSREHNITMVTIPVRKEQGNGNQG